MSLTIGRLSIQTYNAKLEMQTTKPQVNMQQQHAQIQIESELPKVLIDQYECFASAGLKNNIDFISEAADRGRQQVLEFIGSTAEDGDSLAAIELGGDPIIDIAVRKASPEHEFGMVTMPSARPKFEVTGSLKIEFQPKELGIHNGVNFDVRLGSLEVTYTPGKVVIDYRV